MLPNIDPTLPAAGGATSNTTRKPEQEKALEVYQTATVRDSTTRKETGEVSVSSTVQQTVRTTGTKSETDRFKKAAGQDQAEIKMQLTREERDVFLSAISGREKVSEMSEEEQDTLQNTSERLEKLIEEANERSDASRERLDKAIKEWYSRLSGGKQSPENLLALIRQASMGQLD